MALGRALRLSVIAEGVEQWSQLGRLRTLGCEYAQGFYFARPLDPASIESLLAHGGVLSGDPDVEQALEFGQPERVVEAGWALAAGRRGISRFRDAPIGTFVPLASAEQGRWSPNNAAAR